ncbi:ABC transporter ATP-binding protein [Oceanobacillus arenosus]|uniref:ABC transporter ATP-binding protein n=1 Tax=Oceanobacillus arenosus TaxID=1229153 RepID=A0A3D8PQT4_9BACI|nr:ABC transporter ATP-binding protein [Oceanobacillus arenosus]RDW18344.1 ABC transporter ATP-binding protein [Oceanobacillus arenosus]
MEININNLTKKFGTTTAVNDLSMTVESGKLVALLGPSGCGKTTLLNMISGIIPSTTGQILFDGKDVTNLPPDRRGVGMVFQNYALYPHMTVLENICFPLEIKKIPKKERRERAMELAKLVHIEDFVKRKPAQLSGGQQQRVAIARALAKNPDILLLDEPLSNLDAKLRIEMREEIRRIQRDTNVTTIFVTHDQEEASSIADSVALFKLGEIQQYESPNELYDNPANAFVADFLGAPPINKLYGVVKNRKFVLADESMTLDLEIPHSVEDGKQVLLAFRAETIRMNPEKVSTSATVKEIYTLGRDKLAIFNLGTKLVRGYVGEDIELAIGERVQVGFKQKGIFLFDAETGVRYF